MVFTQIAYAERTTDQVIVGNALLVFPIGFDAGQEVVVPTMNKEVYLLGSGLLVSTNPLATTVTELAIGIAGQASLTLAQVLDGAHGSGLASGSKCFCWYKIPPNTPGRRYQLYATCTADSVTVLSPAHAAAKLAAFY